MYRLEICIANKPGYNVAKGLTIFNKFKILILSYAQPEAEFKECEPRLRFETRLKYH